MGEDLFVIVEIILACKKEGEEEEEEEDVEKKQLKGETWGSYDN